MVNRPVFCCASFENLVVKKNQCKVFAFEVCPQPFAKHMALTAATYTMANAKASG